MRTSRPSRFVDCFSLSRCNAAPRGSFAPSSISSWVWLSFKSLRRSTPPSVGPDTLGIPNYFSEGLIYGDLIALCVMTLIAMAFRFLSLYVEKSGPAPATQGRMTLRRALLLYRFNRPAAKIARIVFWIWILLRCWAP